MTIGELPDGVILLRAGEGRHYPSGPMQSVFLTMTFLAGDQYVDATAGTFLRIPAA
ncbi:MAG: hypothetical protein M3Q09_01695 [Gemmatimonadota bacterium]|nr:hypothetical protein [Gemmatimonadota bacterium]